MVTRLVKLLPYRFILFHSSNYFTRIFVYSCQVFFICRSIIIGIDVLMYWSLGERFMYLLLIMYILSPI